MSLGAGGARRGAAVLGSPIAHSLSPVLHEAAYAALGLTGWSYRAVECDESGLAATLQSLEAEGLAGVSLTMPLKRAVMSMLARSDRLVADVGAANTVLFGGVTGDWWGANTDVPGMVAALDGVELRGYAFDEAVVLGGGATAASAIAALREFTPARCLVCVRRPKASAYLEEVADRVGVPVEIRSWDDAAGLCAEVPTVISTT